MNRTLAHFVSVVLHPVLMPSYALWFLLHHSTFLNYTTSPQEKAALYSIVLLNTLLIPVAASYFMIQRGWIRSFEMEKKEERLVPFIMNAVLMLVAYYLLRRLMVPKVYYLLMLGAAAAVVIAIIINFKWKISIHMIGIGGIIGTFFGMSTFLFVDLRIPILFCLLVAGFLGSARLTLGAHSPLQVYAGFAVGFLCEFLVVSI
jgi:hypothetical protein